MENALAAYTEIASDNTFDFANKVTGRIAELEFKQGRYEQAIPHFQKLARTATTKKDQFTAWSGLMESYYQLTQYDSADAYARLILEKGKVNAGAENKATLYLGKTAMARGDYDVAKDEFLSTLNSAQDEYGAEAKYLLAEIFYLTKDYKQCYETLVSLNKDFAAYTDWVGKSYLLMADNFTAMGDRFQTRGTLKSLIENFPLSSVKEEAKARLKKLDDDEAKKKSEAQQDTTDH
jgi:TolA-binding protein